MSPTAVALKVSKRIAKITNAEELVVRSRIRLRWAAWFRPARTARESNLGEGVRDHFQLSLRELVAVLLSNPHHIFVATGDAQLVEKVRHLVLDWSRLARLLLADLGLLGLLAIGDLSRTFGGGGGGGLTLATGIRILGLALRLVLIRCTVNYCRGHGKVSRRAWEMQRGQCGGSAGAWARRKLMHLLKSLTKLQNARSEE